MQVRRVVRQQWRNRCVEHGVDQDDHGGERKEAAHASTLQVRGCRGTEVAQPAVTVAGSGSPPVGEGASPVTEGRTRRASTGRWSCTGVPCSYGIPPPVF